MVCIGLGSIYDGASMASSFTTHTAASSTHTRDAGEAAVTHVAQEAAVSTAVARTFAKISAPENKALFSVEAAKKAFAHVKVSP